MKVKKFEELSNLEQESIHIPEEIYFGIAWEIEKKSQLEEEYSGEIIYDFGKYYIYLDFTTNREFREERGGSDEYGNYEKLYMQNWAYVYIKHAVVFNKESGDECISDLNISKIEDTFDDEYGGSE